MVCPGSVGAFGLRCDPHENLRQALRVWPLPGRVLLHISVNFSPAVARGFFFVAFRVSKHDELYSSPPSRRGEPRPISEERDDRLT
jgi:hypothetical protein